MKNGRIVPYGLDSPDAVVFQSAYMTDEDPLYTVMFTKVDGVDNLKISMFMGHELNDDLTTYSKSITPYRHPNLKFRDLKYNNAVLKYWTMNMMMNFLNSISKDTPCTLTFVTHEEYYGKIPDKIQTKTRKRKGGESEHSEKTRKIKITDEDEKLLSTKLRTKRMNSTNR